MLLSQNNLGEENLSYRYLQCFTKLNATFFCLEPYRQGHLSVTHTAYLDVPSKKLSVPETHHHKILAIPWVDFVWLSANY